MIIMIRDYKNVDFSTKMTTHSLYFDINGLKTNKKTKNIENSLSITKLGILLFKLDHTDSNKLK